MTDLRDVIVIGSGPAGDTAALYLARAGLAPLQLAGSVTAGGALMTTTEVENSPGFPDGVMGPDLMEAMGRQAARFGTEVLHDDAVTVDLTGRTKVVVDGSGREHQSNAVVLATGSSYRHLGIPGEDALTGRGVSWCATCDGFFFSDQHIAVIGGGDSAVEEATFLARFAASVTIVHRRDQLRASKIMAERAHAHEKITFAWNSQPVAILGESTVTGLRLCDTITGDERDLAVTGVFVAIGHDPRSELLHDQVRLDVDGYVMVDHPTTHTDIRRLCLRRPCRPPLPSSHHRRWHRLRGRPGRRAIPRWAGRRRPHRRPNAVRYRLTARADSKRQAPSAQRPAPRPSTHQQRTGYRSQPHSDVAPDAEPGRETPRSGGSAGDGSAREAHLPQGLLVWRRPAQPAVAAARSRTAPR